MANTFEEIKTKVRIQLKLFKLAEKDFTREHYSETRKVKQKNIYSAPNRNFNKKRYAL